MGAPATMPLLCLHSLFSLRKHSPNKSFFLKAVLITVFYHSNTKLTSIITHSYNLVPSRVLQIIVSVRTVMYYAYL